MRSAPSLMVHLVAIAILSASCSLLDGSEDAEQGSSQRGISSGHVGFNFTWVGDEIAFVDEEGFALMVYNPESGETRKVHGFTVYRNPGYSWPTGDPNGEWIYYRGSVPGLPRAGLYRQSVHDGRDEAVAYPSTGQVLRPERGRWLAIESKTSNPDGDILIYDMQTSKVKRCCDDEDALTFNPDGTLLLTHWSGGGHPRNDLLRVRDPSDPTVDLYSIARDELPVGEYRWSRLGILESRLVSEERTVLVQAETRDTLFQIDYRPIVSEQKHGGFAWLADGETLAFHEGTLGDHKGSCRFWLESIHGYRFELESSESFEVCQRNETFGWGQLRFNADRTKIAYRWNGEMVTQRLPGEWSE